MGFLFLWDALYIYGGLPRPSPPPPPHTHTYHVWCQIKAYMKKSSNMPIVNDHMKC